MFASWKALTLRAGIAKPKSQLCSSCSASELPWPAGAEAGPKAVAFAMLKLFARHRNLCASSESDWPAVARRERCADMLEGLGGISQPDMEESLAMQEWLQKECVGSVCHERSFQDLREQLSRLAVQMCDCWSQVHVAGDTSTRWRLLHELLRFEIAPSDALAASVDTCCGCDVLRPLLGDAYAGASEDEQVDWEESLSASSQRQPLAPGREALLQDLVPSELGEALRRWQDERWHAQLLCASSMRQASNGNGR